MHRAGFPPYTSEAEQTAIPLMDPRSSSERVAMEKIITRNETWGFYGTLDAHDAGVIYDSAARALMERYDLGADQARDLLDSSLGRHIADQRRDGESGADLVTRLAAQRGWAAGIRRAAGLPKAPAPIKLVIERDEVPVLRFALDHALSSISEAHAEDRAQLKALITRLEATQR